MRRRTARFAKPLAAILLALCLGGMSGALAQEIYTVQVSGAYSQTEARRMLDMINSFRTGGEAWYWNADNASRTLCGDLQPLVYDSGLEKVAMQRAAEIALSFSHTRPDRSDCFTAYSLSGATYWTQAENIAAGHAGAEATFVQWREDGENYGGQGHRRNMLSASFNAVGIGHINFNGTHYWVQEFGYAPTPNTAQTSPNDAAARVDVQIAASAIATAQLSFEPASLALFPGESADLPACTARISVLGAWPGGMVPVGVDCAWASDSDAVASLDGEGHVTAGQAGNANLTATALGRTGAVPVQVAGEAVRPTGISLEPSGPQTLYIGSELRLRAILEPAGAKCEVEWSAAYEGEAPLSVSETGLVTPLRPGRATVTASANLPSGDALSASVNIAVLDPGEPSGIRIEPAGPVRLNLGEALRMSAALQPAGAKAEIAWHIDGAGIASIDENSMLTGLREGAATCYASVTVHRPEPVELKSNEVEIRVIDPTRPTSIALDKSGTVELNLGDALQLHATLEPETAVSELEWSSSNGGAAIVSGDGLVTAVGEGSAVITVKAAKRSPEGEELSAGVTIHVTDPNRPNPDDPDPDDPDPDEPGPDNPESDDPEPDDPDPDEPDPDDPNPDDPGPDDPGPDDPDKPATLTLEPSGAVEMDIRETLQLRAIWEPAGAERALDWSSSNASVARVDGNGKVTPAGAGEAIITATAEDGSEEPLTASVTIRVVNPEEAASDKPTKLTLDRSGTVKLDIDKTLRLNATLSPATAWSELKWSSSNRKVARVDANGRVTPGAEGKAKITVTAVRKGAKGKKLSASVKIQVVDPYKPSGIRLDQGGTVLLDIDETLQLRATLEPEGIARGELKWSSSNNKVARVDDSGLVTPIKEGEAKITAQSVKKGAKGKKLSASVKIQVVDPYKPAGVSIDQSGPLWLNIGETLTLTATMRPDDARSNLTWSSSNKKIAKAEYDAEAGACVVTGKRAGSAKITVKTRNGKKNTVSLKVVDPSKATGVSLNFSGTVELPKGETLELVATMQPATATSKLRWSSSNRKIATVKPASAEDIAAGRAKPGSCVVTAKHSGTVKISVRTSTGKKASVKLKITAAKDLPERAEEPLEPVEEPPMEIQIEAVADVPEAEDLPEADVAAGNSSCEVAAECFPERAAEPSPEK